MALSSYNIELHNTLKLSDNTIAISCYLSDRNFSFVAGQFVSLKFEYEGQIYKRSYSIACSPEFFQQTQMLEFVIGLIPEGKASRFFQTAKVGTQLTLLGPVGFLVLPAKPPESLVLVGTGTGIAPYRAMITQLHVFLHQGIKVRIIMGTRYRKNLFYVEDFRKLEQQFTHAHYDICFSRETEINPDNNEFHGYIQERLSKLNLDPSQDLVFLCGHPSMVDENIVQLKAQGFTNKQFVREKYTFSR